MDDPGLGLRKRRLAVAAAALAAVLLVQSAPALAGELCSNDTVGAGTCNDTSDLAKDLMRRRVDRTLAAGDRINLLDSARSSAAAPFSVTPDGNNTNFTTSLTQWSSSLSAADQKTLAKAASGEDLPVPKTVKPAKPKFDLWAQGRSESFSDGGSLTKEGNAVTTFVGADYRLHRDLLISRMIQLDQSRQTILAAPDTVDGTAYLAGPYLSYRLAPHVLLDAKAAWGTSQDSAVTGDGNTSFATDRMLSEAKLSGTWGWNHWQLSQSGAIIYLDETSIGIAGTPGTSVDVTRLSVDPEIKHRFDVGNNSIEPFAFFKSSLDLADADLADPTAQNTVGGGITFAQPDKYKSAPLQIIRRAPIVPIPA